MKKLISIVLCVVLALSAMTVTTASAQEEGQSSENGLLSSLIFGSIADMPQLPNFDEKELMMSVVTELEKVLQRGKQDGFITEESVTKVQKYVDELKATLESETASDDEITFSILNLGMSASIDVDIVYNKALVDFLAEKAEEVKELIALIGASHPDESEQLKAAIDKFIEDAKALTDINKESIENLFEELLSSFQAITTPAEPDYREDLQFAVDEALAMIESGDYEADMLVELTAAVEQAKALLENEDATDDQLIEAEALLWTEMNALIFDVDPDVPELTVDDLKDIVDRVTKDYLDFADEIGEEVLADLKQAVDDAKALIEGNTPTAEEIQEAYDKIIDAIPDVPVDVSIKDELHSAICLNAWRIITGGDFEDTKETLSVKRDNVITAENVYLAPESTDEDYSAAFEMLLSDFDSPVDEFISGDANCDGNVNINDVTAIQRYVANIEVTDFSFGQSDVDADGKISIKDATLIQKYTANVIDMFPADLPFGMG